MEEHSREQEIFISLYEMVYRDMYRFALYTLKNKQDAEDVVADTVADAYGGFSGLKDHNAFRGWIFKILSNKCKRKLKEYTSKTVELPDDLAGQDCFVERLEVREAFASLSDEERLIVSMHVFAGYTGKEIARILHKKESTVRSRESRALKKMEQMLKE